MSKYTRIAITTAAVLATSVFLSGCGLFGKDKEALDPPPKQNVSHLDENEDLDSLTDTETSGEEQVEAVMTDLYLIDKNGLVVGQSLPLPKTNSVAKQALEYLVADGKISDILPNGFRTVLPAGTNVDVDIQDGKAIVDFSEEFKNYQASDEQKILQAVTWTLTQFDTVDSVELRVNGYPLTEMPVGGTPISEDGLTRADGINTGFADVVDVTNTRPLTVYYLAQGLDNYYYVPVTTRVSNLEEDNIKAVIDQLVEGPTLEASLMTVLDGDALLLDDPTIKDGVVTLNFNEEILGNSETKEISTETLQSLVLSLTEQPGIESVAVMVNGDGGLVNEDGEELTEPVTRPEKVNTGSF